MTYPELESAIEQLRNLHQLAAGLSDKELAAPSRCTGWRVAELLGHLEAMALALVSESAQEADGEAEIDRYDVYFRGMPHTANDVIRDHYVEYAAGKRLPLVRQSFIYCVEGVIRDLPKVPGDRIVVRMSHRKGPLPRMTHRELVASRHMEFGCHGLDIANAVGRPEVMEPGSAAVITDTLDRMFGQPMPDELEWDATHYILCATGRRPLTPSEREILGNLAELFPACAVFGEGREIPSGVADGALSPFDLPRRT
jgi:uncharacterized protein (TIGR03083 family)